MHALDIHFWYHSSHIISVILLVFGRTLGTIYWTMQFHGLCFHGTWYTLISCPGHYLLFIIIFYHHRQMDHEVPDGPWGSYFSMPLCLSINLGIFMIVCINLPIHPSVLRVWHLFFSPLDMPDNHMPKFISHLRFYFVKRVGFLFKMF